MTRLLLTLLLLSGCTSGRPTFPKNAAATKRGPPTIFLNVPETITRGNHVDMGFMLVAAPRLLDYHTYRARITIIGAVGANTEHFDLWIQPAVSRYYGFTLNGRLTRDMDEPYLLVHVELQPLVGYNIFGTPQVGKTLAVNAKRVLVRDIAAGGMLEHPLLRHRDYAYQRLHVGGMGTECHPHH